MFDGDLKVPDTPPHEDDYGQVDQEGIAGALQQLRDDGFELNGQDEE